MYYPRLVHVQDGVVRLKRATSRCDCPICKNPYPMPAALRGLSKEAKAKEMRSWACRPALAFEGIVTVAREGDTEAATRHAAMAIPSPLIYSKAKVGKGLLVEVGGKKKPGKEKEYAQAANVKKQEERRSRFEGGEA